MPLRTSARMSTGARISSLPSPGALRAMPLDIAASIADQREGAAAPACRFSIFSASQRAVSAFHSQPVPCLPLNGGDRPC